MSERMVPFHCPYCAEEDLRPSEAGHGAWECHACLRAFSVKFIGLVRRGTPTDPIAAPEPATPAEVHR
jgi:transposase-like protein